MEFRDVLRRRRMVRRFTGDLVPRAVVDRLLEAALRAPSAGNTQAWGFLVLEGPEQTGRFWKAAWPSRPEPPWAPLIVVPTTDPGAYTARYAEEDKRAAGASVDRWPVPFWEVDAAFAALLLQLGAVDDGLGAWFFGIDGAGVKAAFGIPERQCLVGAVAIGHPAPHPPSASLARARPSLEDVTHRGRWRGGSR